MGTIRTLLAISVVYTHIQASLFMGGILAVQLFFMISGFLISYILVEKKNYRSTKDFYANRALRIYPAYFFIGFLTLALFIFYFATEQKSPFFETYGEAPLLASLSLLITNITLIGQDWIFFSGVLNGEYTVMYNVFSASEVPLHRGILVPQSWTLGTELTFYLIAPFILHKKRYIFALLFFTLGIKIY